MNVMNVFIICLTHGIIINLEIYISHRGIINPMAINCDMKAIAPGATEIAAVMCSEPIYGYKIDMLRATVIGIMGKFRIKI